MMHPSDNAFPGLYPQLATASWPELDESVRRLHSAGEIVQASGIFRVRHGQNPLARWLAWLAGLPLAGEAVNVRLTVIPTRGGEQWRRSFAGRALASFQLKGPDGLLAEQMGPLEMWFRLEISRVALIYHPRGAALRLGPLRLALPRWLAPRVCACEKPARDRDGVHTFVEVSVPLLGLVLAYEGTVTRAEAQQ